MVACWLNAFCKNPNSNTFPFFPSLYAGINVRPADYLLAERVCRTTLLISIRWRREPPRGLPDRRKRPANKSPDAWPRLVAPRAGLQRFNDFSTKGENYGGRRAIQTRTYVPILFRSLALSSQVVLALPVTRTYYDPTVCRRRQCLTGSFVRVGERGSRCSRAVHVSLAEYNLQPVVTFHVCLSAASRAREKELYRFVEAISGENVARRTIRRCV